MQIIGVIFNVFFLFILLMMMGFGFLFGMWRKLRSLGGLLLGVLLLIIFINPIANKLVSINLPGVNDTITNIVIEAVSSEMANGAVISGDGELALLCNSIALSVAKIAVLFLGMLVVFAIIVPLNLIIVRIVAGRDKHEKTIGIRFAGLGIAAAEVLISFFLITLPIFGTTSLVMSYEDVLKQSEDTAEIIEIVEVIDNTIPNTITKIFGKKAPVSALGSLTKVKNKNGTINIFKEVTNAKPIVNIIIESESKYEGDFLAAAIDNKEELIEFIKETNILETFMPALLEILEADGSLEGIDINELKQIDFAADKVHIAEIISILLDFIEETELDFDNPELILANENLPTSLKGLGLSLKNTTFSDILLGFLQETLEDALSSMEGFEEITSVIDVNKIEKENLPNDLYQLGIIANTVYEMQNSGDDASLQIEGVKKLILAIFDFSLVKGNEEAIIDMLLEEADLKTYLKELGIEIKYNNIDWNIEKENLVNIIDAFIKVQNNIEDFDMNNFGEYLQDDAKKEIIVDFVNSLSKSALIGDEFIIEIIDTVVSNTDLNIDFSKFDYNKIESWEQEIEAILSLMNFISDGLDISNITKAELEEIILVATGEENKPCYVTSYLLGSIINNALQEILDEKGYSDFEKEHDLTDPVVLRGAANEIVTIIELSKKLNIEQDFEDMTIEDIKDICDDFASLDLENSTITTTVIQSVVNQSGVNITEEEILSADLEKEAEVLEDILTTIQANNGEIDIDEIIKKAEEEDAVIILAIIESFMKK